MPLNAINVAIGVKRTWGGAAHTSAFDPKRTCLPYGHPLPVTEFKWVRCLVLSLGGTMRRRDFISVLGVAAVAWPGVALGQQSTIPTVGFLSTRSPDESAHQLAAFHRGLAENGYVE